MSFIYVASPYTHKDAEVRKQRYEAARDFAAWLLNKKLWCYSPIVHCHDLALVHSMPKDATFWRAYNEAMQRCAYTTYVLGLEGWEESVGVTRERDFAYKLGHETILVKPKEDKHYVLARSLQAPNL